MPGMTAAEKLLLLSSLPGCATASAHFCSMTSGLSEVVLKDSLRYGVTYIPPEDNEVHYEKDETRRLFYLPPDQIAVRFEPRPQIQVTYIPPETFTIHYNEQD